MWWTWALVFAAMYFLGMGAAFGAAELGGLIEDYRGSYILTFAAYNAGPNRARRWLGGRPLEGAIYAETIPFQETRDYVKKVMSNTMYYHLLFNNTPQSLKARLGIVQPGGSAMTTATESLP